MLETVHLYPVRLRSTGALDVALLVFVEWHSTPHFVALLCLWVRPCSPVASQDAGAGRGLFRDPPEGDQEPH